MRFNSVRENPRRTKNYEGALAFSAPTPEQQLYSITACTFLNHSYYTTANETTKAILDQVEKCDPLFVGKLAIYLRNEMYLRTAPILLLAKLALMGKLRKEWVPRVVIRADEIKELLACWQGLSGRADLKKMPNQLKRGVALAFNNFNAFQFRKYNKQGKEAITFLDALRLVRPKPINDAQNIAFKAIKEGNLPPIETWETSLSSGKDKKEAWTQLIADNKLPYMAALRNARNIIKAQVDLDVFNKYLDLISDRDKVLKSKQFPFRYWSAIIELRSMAQDVRIKPTLDAIGQAILHSTDNIPGIENLKDQSVLIACDVSGSMEWRSLSEFSSIPLLDVGIILGRLLSQKLRWVVTGVFGTEWAACDIGRHPLDMVSLPDVGCATHTHKVLDWALANNKQFDKLMIFSDMQIYSDFHSTDQKNKSAFNTSWAKYKTKFPEAELILFNLESYGTTPVDLVNKDVYMICGFSTNIFRVIKEWKNIKEIILNV